MCSEDFGVKNDLGDLRLAFERVRLNVRTEGRAICAI